MFCSSSALVFVCRSLFLFSDVFLLGVLRKRRRSNGFSSMKTQVSFKEAPTRDAVQPKSQHASTVKKETKLLLFYFLSCLRLPQMISHFLSLLTHQQVSSVSASSFLSYLFASLSSSLPSYSLRLLLYLSHLNRTSLCLSVCFSLCLCAWCLYRKTKPSYSSLEDALPFSRLKQVASEEKEREGNRYGRARLYQLLLL